LLTTWLTLQQNKLVFAPSTLFSGINSRAKVLVRTTTKNCRCKHSSLFCNGVSDDETLRPISLLFTHQLPLHLTNSLFINPPLSLSLPPLPQYLSLLILSLFHCLSLTNSYVLVLERDLGQNFCKKCKNGQVIIGFQHFRSS